MRYPRRAPVSPRPGSGTMRKLLLVPCDVDAIESGSVLAEDLLLDLRREADPELLLDVFGELEGHELLHDPARVPDRIVAGKEQLVGPNPKQQIGEDFSKVPRAAVN